MRIVTISFDETKNVFTVEYEGTSEKFNAVDRALQEARNYLVGGSEDEEPEEDEQAEFEEGFKKARGIMM